ncbi:serine/threonine-protein kinase [Nocardia bhagyanarayanae]|uniref:non-specific serine/threonine protein kinase n=1 Tax=Nocardia bhagyanarayanae TaxID=1215925 RepID=A0A543FEG0_9NOCA|nr:serine/threonine-protein kinase [Nocardia bhagyanarayanae]TQM32255.1 serine/threonine-protein kinase [Nocardia bhagyanarayanae]
MAADPRPGTVFAGYLVERVLGGGGMGTVYLAKHPRLPRRDALKVLSAEHSMDAEFRARFLREAELTARINHPNVVAVHDRGVEDGRLWIAMQFVEGSDAAAIVRNGAAADARRAVHIVAQAARGLDEAHRAGMVHRDVKPANILVASADGRPDRVLVTDFGIGRATTGSTALTEEGAVLATLAYAAPEQLMAYRVDHRADVYALGGTLYELLTGAKPFPRPTAAAVVHAHLQDPPPRPTLANPALPQAFDAVIARAMAKDPAHRFETCGALAAAAEAALTGVGPIDVPPDVAVLRDHATPPARRFPRRAALAVGAVAVVTALGVAGAVAFDRDTTGTTATTTTTGTTVPPSTTTAAVTNWGSHSYLASAFPGLLPETPGGTGYQGIRCAAVDAKRRPVDLNAPAEGENRISCNGDKNPLYVLVVLCNSDRSPRDRPTVTADETVTGDERWERVSGTGRIVRGDVTGPSGAPAGMLSIVFDDIGRGFCEVLAFGGDSGRDLFDRWWRDAPI